MYLLHFVAFFHVASLLSTGVDNEIALELDNRIFFFYISAFFQYTNNNNIIIIIKFVFSKKATKFEKIFTVDLTLTTYCQINGEDFINFCGLLGKHEF